MKKLFIFAEQVFTVISLLLYSGGPLTLILSNGANEGEEESGAVPQTDNSLILVCFFINYIITFCLLIIRWKKVVYIGSKNQWIAALVGIAVLSVLWSANPAQTLKRGVAIVGSTAFGLYLASRYTLKEQVKLFGWMYGIAIIMSFIFIGAMPKFGIMGGVHQGKWRGIYNHKNTLGKVISPGITILLLLALNYKKNRYFLWFLFILAWLLLIRASSTSSLLNVIVVIAASFPVRSIRWRDSKMLTGIITTFTLGGCFYFILSVYSEVFLNALGKDATLTGRGDMWPYIFEMIWKSPWLGYGYGAFWSGPNTPSFYIWQATGWTPPNSHNGFLDMWLHIGLLGLSIFIFEFIVITLPKVFIWVRLSNDSEGLWPILYMTYMIFANLGESTLMIQNDIFWVFYVSIAYSVCLPPTRQRLI
jgi:exopolysaccharide production protein ExoQ